MALEKAAIIDLYRHRARRYDLTAQLYYLLGFREWAYRKKAVEALGLRPGDAVIEVGCGTGLNFSLLQQAVGREGKITGIDLTDTMLAQARRRVEQNHWSNVELVQCDAASFQFPGTTGGVLSTFALTLVPEFDQVIQGASQVLLPGRRIVILDFKLPSNWLSWLGPLGVLLTKPFGVSTDLAARHPWQSVAKYFNKTSLTELYGGLVYLAVGECVGGNE